MSPEEFKKKLEESIEEFANLFSNAPIVQAEIVLGNYLGRIFNDGKNTSGTDIGQYVGADSKSKGRYKALRNSKGRRVDKVDLQFTGGLFESINTGIKGEDVVIGFTNSKKADLSRKLEERYGKVFTISKEEEDETAQLVLDYINEGVQEIIKKWS